jgi:hypothetical protein
MSRGRSRQAGIPPARCGAVTHTRGGRPCRRFVQVGSLRCNLHSGTAPQAIKKGDDRATIAQLLQHEDPDRPRPLGEVMLEAVHNADVLMRSLDDVRLRVLRREEVTGEELDRLVRMSQVAHALAETTVRAGVQVELVRQAQLSREMNSAVVVRALGAALDAQSRALRSRGAPEELVELLRVVAHQAAGDELRALEDVPAQEDLRRGVAAELEGRPR